MTHADLAATLENLGWRRHDLATGATDHSLTGTGPIDRMIRMIPEEPALAMCANRGSDARSVTSLGEAAEWARAAMPAVAS